MVYDIIPIIIIFLSLAIISIIAIKKFPQAANVDLEKIPKEKQLKVKTEILKQRLKRKLGDLLSKVKEKTKPDLSYLDRTFNKLKEKFLIIERQYYNKQKEMLENQPFLLKLRIKRMSLKGEELIQEKKFNEAEELFIKIIALDSKNLVPYQKLGEIYLAQRNFSQAEETLNYVLKLTQQKLGKMESRGKKEKMVELKNSLAETYFDLGELCQGREKFIEAKNYFKKAVEYSVNNPKYLDSLTNIYIILKKPDKAKKILARLKEVNPENEKIKELERKIEEMDINQ